MGPNESREGSGNSKENGRIKKRNEKNGGDLRKDKFGWSTAAAIATGAVAGAALLAYSIFSLASGLGSGSNSEQEEEMMIAPGTGGLEQISRAEFESNPGQYFRELRRK
ncbi:PREDICTED: PRUPE_5G145500 [Prunus dulcis]|uniref:PREDICTED: PRUPE_5G145500 n=1 Tax=Prunus dulcis TaxID=3755 RepID=A0A5E4F0V2_PRUDU|nr:uncharacterized protein LOC117628623 [Prunus dulcis]VVA21677.1 PREDICTED: PRUPE_5G145500 [Prunus dulcis]